MRITFDDLRHFVRYCTTDKLGYYANSEMVNKYTKTRTAALYLSRDRSVVHICQYYRPNGRLEPVASISFSGNEAYIYYVHGGKIDPTFSAVRNMWDPISTVGDNRAAGIIARAIEGDRYNMYNPPMYAYN